MNKSALNPALLALGELAGLIVDDGDRGEVRFNDGWFGGANGALRGIGGRLDKLVSLIDAVLAPALNPSPGARPGARWYALPDPTSGAPTPLHLVTPPSGAKEGEIGLGVVISFAGGAGRASISLSLYAPLFKYGGGAGAAFIAGEPDRPLAINFSAVSQDRFAIEPSGVSFKAVTADSQLRLAGGAPSFEMRFEDLTGTTRKGPWSPRDPEVVTWLLEVLVQSSGWLNQYPGNAPFTYGDILEAAGFLWRDDAFSNASFLDLKGVVDTLAGQELKAYEYLWSQLSEAERKAVAGSNEEGQMAALVAAFNRILAGPSIYDEERFENIVLFPETEALLQQGPGGASSKRLNRHLIQDTFPGQLVLAPFNVNLQNLQGTPAEIAVNCVFAVLDALAATAAPVLFLPGGGISVERRPGPGGAQDYGLLLATRLGISPGSATPPAIDLCLGTWLTGEDDSGNWMQRAGGRPGPRRGVWLSALRRSADRKTVSFAPSFALTSVGVDLHGGLGKPLFESGGFRLGGVRVRASLDPGQSLSSPGNWSYGFAAGLDGVAFPLVPGSGGASSNNPVAQSLLAPEPGQSGGADPSTTPPFSVAVAWRSDVKMDPPVNLQLFDQDHQPADQVWVPVQRSFGPLHCRRLGIGWPKKNPDLALSLLFDGDVSLGALTLGVQGLSIGVPLRAPMRLDRYQLGLNGMSLAFESGPVSIDGSFSRSLDKAHPRAAPAYGGEARIQIGEWAIGAIGSYTTVGGQASLMVFALIGAPFGGPPAFFVTGLSAGFGFNRTVAIPAQNEVVDFPLLAFSTRSQPEAPKPADVLAMLEGRLPGPTGTTKAWIAPRVGEHWLAAGVEATSFELVHSQALLIARMGRELEVALLGVARVRLPQEGDAVYAYGELELSAVWKPGDGFLGVSAVLSPASFVIDPACHLTGGFAFHVWYAPPDPKQAGQFALTLGGYHPLFKPPSFYPVEPRLGLNWAISNTLTIKGSAYFALTPSCVMAGGGLDIQLHDGNLRAWLTASANFLLSWKPFHYDVTMDVSIGVSYLTLKVELGVSVHLWGPPMGGEIKVHLLFITFTIGFGQPERDSTAELKWDDFRPLLPAQDAAVCRVQAHSGLAKTLDGGAWVVRADAFTFSTDSAIPARSLSYGSQTAKPINKSPFQVDIRPMNKTGVASNHVLTISRGGSPLPDQEVSRWTLDGIERALPESLWGAPLQDKSGRFVPNPATPSASTVPRAPVGILASAPRPTLGRSAGAIARAQLAYAPTERDGQMPLSANVKPSSRFAPRASQDTVGQLRSIASKQGERDALFTALQTAGLYRGPNGDLSDLGKRAEHLYADAPMQVSSKAGGA